MDYNIVINNLNIRKEVYEWLNNKGVDEIVLLEKNNFIGAVKVADLKQTVNHKLFRKPIKIDFFVKVKDAKFVLRCIVRKDTQNIIKYDAITITEWMAGDSF